MSIDIKFITKYIFLKLTQVLRKHLMFYHHFHGINVDGINVLYFPTFALFRNDNIEILKNIFYSEKRVKTLVQIDILKREQFHTN